MNPKRTHKWAKIAAAMLGWKTTWVNEQEGYTVGGDSHPGQIIHIWGESPQSIRKQIASYVLGIKP